MSRPRAVPAQVHGVVPAGVGHRGFDLRAVDLGLRRWGAHGRTLFVDPAGHCDDSYPVAAVTRLQPWCSLARAVGAAPSGSVVEVAGGTYPRQTFKALGSRSGYVTFEPYGFAQGNPQTVTIDGLELDATPYLRFLGFHFVGSDAGAELPGVELQPGSNHVQLLGNEITGQGLVDIGSSDLLLQDNDIHDAGGNCALKLMENGAGVYLSGGDFTLPPITDLRLVGNVIADNADDGLDIGNAAGVLVAGNDITTGVDPATAASCGWHVDEIQIENGGRGPITIADNFFHDGTQFILRNASGLTIEANLLVRIDAWMQLEADPGAKVLNNTWWGGNMKCTGCGSLLIRDWAPGAPFTRPPFNYTHQMVGTVIENNIMRTLGDDHVPAAQFHEDYDLITDPLRSSSSGIEGRHTQFAVPSFVGPQTGNFRLSQGSAGLGDGNAQVAPHADILGRPWPRVADIGAF